MVKVTLSLGTNIGSIEERRSNLNIACSLLREKLRIKEIVVSDTYESEPVGFEAETHFFNIALQYYYPVEASQSLKEAAFNTLDICKQIEKMMGRPISEAVFNEVGSRVYSSRIIDIDIISFGSLVLVSDELTIPHKEMHRREFVLRPLLQIDPKWKHPFLQKGVQDLISQML